MIANIVNAITVFLGTFLGVLFKAKVTKNVEDLTTTAVGFIALLLGLKMALNGDQILLMAFALVFGGFLGYSLRLEDRIMGLGEWLYRLFFRKKHDSQIGKAFLDASLLFCVGAMTIVGAFEAGALQKYDLLLTKSVMDGFMAIILTASLGPGVGLSIFTILLFQGGLTVLAMLLGPVIPMNIISGISATGGVLVMMIAFNMLKLRSIKTGNFLPALLLIGIFIYIAGLLTNF